jgi:hypothetical protein
LCKLQVTPNSEVTGLVTYRFSRETILWYIVYLII